VKYQSIKQPIALYPQWVICL